MFQGWCLICAESYKLPTITRDGKCSACGGSVRDCDCGDVCPECENDLEIMEID